MKQGFFKIFGALCLVAALTAPALAANINPYTGGACQFAADDYWNNLKHTMRQNESWLRSMRISSYGSRAAGEQAGLMSVLGERFPGMKFSFIQGNGVVPSEDGMETMYVSNWKVYRWVRNTGLKESEVSFNTNLYKVSVGDKFLLFKIDESNPCNTRLIDAHLPDAARTSEQYLNTDITADRNALTEALNRAYYEGLVPAQFAKERDQNMVANLGQMLMEPEVRDLMFKFIAKLPPKR